MASLIDYILPEDMDNYKALIERAAEAKANAPKAPRAPRKPLSLEQKIKMDENRLEKLKAKLQAARAAAAVAE